MKKKKHLKINHLFAFLLVLIASSLNGQNLKVFIMAGQSNMQGHGEIMPPSVNGTLSHFMANGGAAEFNYVQNADGSWATRDDVWVRYDDENDDVLTGILDVGFGGSDAQIGPEFGFGHQVGQQTDDHIMIIKTCWGGKSLAVDFRPPSSGGVTGEYYIQMMSDVASAIDNISTEFPQYTGGNIEIAGMAWFQGWNDAEEQAYLDEYEQNLINLIKDVRTEWNTPDLPFVIGLTGNGGLELEPNGTWINALQTQVVPAQISAANFEGHENVSYVDTRGFWRDGEVSPEPGFLHHWNNNAESYLRIGDALGKEMNEMLGQSNDGNNGNEGTATMGYIQANTNPALPSAYNFQEYVFGEPDDQGDCPGIQNNTAVIEEVFLSQTHRHAIGHPLFFTIGERPALLQLAVTGTGDAPDVQVEGVLDGTSLGTLCLKGPANLASSIDLERPSFSDYFSVTLPKAWIKEGLELEVSAGADSRTLTQDDLKISTYTELNIVMVNIDIMDYNHEPHRRPAFDNLLEEIAAALPVSVVRFGEFPETLKLPNFALSNLQNDPVVLQFDAEVPENNLHTGMINLAANDVISKMQLSTGDYPNTIYFGNTLNLDPGGWGGNGSFVSFEFNDVFLHELGHALSLPHWVEVYRLENPRPNQFSYPYKGEEAEGSGRGTAWSFNQDIYEFISPICQEGESILGTERSDAMQRGFYCAETRSNGRGPWDGFGDFSAKAMNDFLAGSDRQFGQVEDRGELVDFHLKENLGYPIATLTNGERIFTRTSTRTSEDPEEIYVENFINLPGKEKIEQDVYLIYGSAHANLPEANIIYDPIKYKGTLLPNIDPTDPATLATLENLEWEDVPSMYNEPRDITLKLIYEDGTEEHTLVPFSSYVRAYPDDPEAKLQPQYFSIVVPGDKPLCSVELYHRAFIISDYNEDGNIKDPSQNIIGENFMDDATLMATLDHSCNCPSTPGYIEPGTPCDDGNPLTFNDVEDGFCNCEGEPIVPCGFITNGEFQENLVGWWTWGNDASIVNGEAVFANVDLNDAGIAQGPFAFNTDDNYTINFDAYASQSRAIEVAVYLDEEPYTEYYRETVNLSTTKQNYELSFTFSGTPVTNGAMLFDMKNNNANVFLDNVCFDVSSDDQTEIPYNGIDDDNDPTTLDDDLDQDGFDLVDDCDDNNPNINPDQAEVPENGIDDDCNPATLDMEIASCGFITNGQFEENLDGWWTWGSTASSINGEAAFENIDFDDAGIAQGPFNFNMDETYTINLDAYASQSRSIEVIIFQEEGSFTEYYRETINLSTTKEEFELSFTFSGTSITNGTLEFNLSNAEGNVFLDNVCIDIASGGQTEIPYNGIDDDNNPATLDDDLDQDGFDLVDDCDDNNPNINPNQTEEPYNGIDDDCNPATLDDDLDQDGFASANDCDDNNPNINPNQAEVTYNGIDDDCNPATLDDDLDQDGFASANDCDDNNPNINPNQAEVTYNGIDDDCNPVTLDDDLDQDGFASANDCDDNNPNINPDQAEVAYNGIDDDCNPVTLDDDLDQDGFLLAEDCDDNNANINPDQPEVPDNGIDDDCNPATLDTDVAACGLTVNGQFEENLEGWWTWGSDASSTNGEAAFENINFDDAGIAQGPIDFNTDESYKITFDAYASQPRSIEVIIFLDEEPWTEYHRETVELSTEKENYQLTFTFDGTSITNGAIEFNLRNDESNVFLDNVCIDIDFECLSRVEEPDNGIDNDTNIKINSEEKGISNPQVHENCDSMNLVSSTYAIESIAVNIYPNPATNLINIDLEKEIDFVVTLYSLDGRILKTQLNSNQLEVSSITTGIYIIEIKDLQTGQKVMEKIMIMR